MKKILTLSIITLINVFSFAQIPCGQTFSVTPANTFNLTYIIRKPISPSNGDFYIIGSNGSQAYFPDVSCKMRIKLPVNSTTTNVKFPIVIFAHGAGSNIDCNSYWANFVNRFVEAGYVGVEINYASDFYGQSSSCGTGGLLGDLAFLGLLGQTNTSTPQADKDVATRIMYSNAIDVHYAIKYIIDNVKAYANTSTAWAMLDTNRIIIAGHSLGGSVVNAYLHYNKSEIASSFPSSTFYTNSQYVDITQYRSKVKGAVSIDAGILDTTIINNTENTPHFIVHGTHDVAVPYYIGKQPQVNPLNCNVNKANMYGGARLAEILSNFNAAFNFSYYFVQVNGTAHTPIYNSTNFDTQNGLCKLWMPDMFRFLRNSFAGNKNRFHKIIKPNNSSAPYCNNILNDNGSDRPSNYYLLNSTVCQSVIPNFNLTKQTWSDLYSGTTCTKIYPAIISNSITNSGSNCLNNSGIQNYGRLANPNPNPTTETKASNLPLFYPNPTTGIVNMNIKLDNAISNYNISIYSVDGKTVYNQSFFETLEADSYLQKSIDLSKEANGVYFIRITADDSNILFNKAVVLNR